MIIVDEVPKYYEICDYNLGFLHNPVHFWVYSCTFMAIPVHFGANPGQLLIRFLYGI